MHLKKLTVQDIKLFEKLKQKKYRNREKKFLIEGMNLIEECIKSDYYKNKMEKIILREDAGSKSSENRLREIGYFRNVHTLDESRFKKISETVASQGIIGIVDMTESSIAETEISDKDRLIIVLENISDPGNLGTIIRNCYWFSVDKIIISKNSADIFNSKVIRSTQGALFHSKIKTDADIEAELEYLNRKNVSIFLTDLKAEKYCHEYDFSKFNKSAFVFGNESSGLSEKIIENKNYHKLKIKGFSSCESLNVAVSSGIILNEYKKSCPK